MSGTSSFRRGPLGRAGGKAGALVGGAALTIALLGGSAWAAGNGATTQTTHLHGTDAAGIEELDFNPVDAPPGISLPHGCWLNINEGIVSTSGNDIMHSTVSKDQDEFWFTTTYTGDAAVYPLVLDTKTGLPVQDPNTGNNEVDMSGAPIATGHLTTWFGQEGNNQNGVMHGTVSFHGTDANGNTVNVNGHVQYATNANGQATATVANVSC